MIIHHQLYPTTNRILYEVFSLYGNVEEVMRYKRSVDFHISNFTQEEMQGELVMNSKGSIYMIIAVRWNYGLHTLEISLVLEPMKLI